ncbi:MAG TPA: hypothetical protein VJV40_02135, partial [Thermodesulfobacteriota bacterium]|nr:hypothetical protein [Thermodesulfobacteriota bacterium]
MRDKPFYLKAAGIVLLAMALSGCETGGPGMNVKGRVVAGDTPVSGASVSLFIAGSVVAESLAFGKTDSEGNFSINFNKP